jgi:hypothetical protein
MRIWKSLAVLLCVTGTALASDKVEGTVVNSGAGPERERAATDPGVQGQLPVAFNAALSAALSSVRQGATQTVAGPSTNFLVVVEGESKARKASLMRVGSTVAIKSWTLAHGVSEAKRDEAVAEIAVAAGLLEPEATAFSDQAIGDKAGDKDQRQ